MNSKSELCKSLAAQENQSNRPFKVPIQIPIQVRSQMTPLTLLAAIQTGMIPTPPHRKRYQIRTLTSINIHEPWGGSSLDSSPLVTLIRRALVLRPDVKGINRVPILRTSSPPAFRQMQGGRCS